MSLPDNQSPREAARAFTPELTALIEDPLLSEVWADKRLSPRDLMTRSLHSLPTSRSTADSRQQSRPP